MSISQLEILGPILKLCDTVCIKSFLRWRKIVCVCVCWLVVCLYSTTVFLLTDTAILYLNCCSVVKLPQNQGDKPKMKREIESMGIKMNIFQSNAVWNRNFYIREIYFTKPELCDFFASVSLWSAFEKKRCAYFYPGTFDSELNWLLKMIKKKVANLVSMYCTTEMCWNSNQNNKKREEKTKKSVGLKFLFVWTQIFT